MNITLATKTQNDGLVAQQKLEALERWINPGEPVPHKYSDDEKDDLDYFIMNNGTTKEQSRKKKGKHKQYKETTQTKTSINCNSNEII